MKNIFGRRRDVTEDSRDPTRFLFNFEMRWLELVPFVDSLAHLREHDLFLLEPAEADER